MSRIRGKDNAGEIVRSLLHRMGYRFRLHGIPIEVGRVAPCAPRLDPKGTARTE